VGAHAAPVNTQRPVDPVARVEPEPAKPFNKCLVQSAQDIGVRPRWALTRRSIFSRVDSQMIKLPSYYGGIRQSRE